METRNATVTKTPFNSYNVITCTMKELLSVSLSLHSKLFFFFIWYFPSFPFTHSIKHKNCWTKKRTDILEPKRIKTESV